MGKVFLGLLVAGLCVSGYLLMSGWRNAFGSKAAPAAASAVGHSVPPAAPVAPDAAGQPSQPLAVLAVSSEWLLCEAWGFVRRGEVLPDGAVLVSWSDAEATVRVSGSVARRRFRRLAEVPAFTASGVLPRTDAVQAPVDAPAPPVGG